MRWHHVLQIPKELFIFIFSDVFGLLPRTRKSSGVKEPNENAPFYTLLRILHGGFVSGMRDFCLT